MACGTACCYGMAPDGTGASTAFAIAEETIAGLVGADLPEMRKNA